MKEHKKSGGYLGEWGPQQEVGMAAADKTYRGKMLKGGWATGSNESAPTNHLV